MKRLILLTRPYAASERFGRLLAHQGFDYKIEPLMTIKPTGRVRPKGPFEAVMVTSSNALDALGEQKDKAHDLLSLPCFCVGPVTADAARRFGFSDIKCGASDGVELAHIIAAQFKGKSILHIASELTNPKAHDILSDRALSLTSWVVYEAPAAQELTPQTHALFASQNITAIPVFSPRSARILTSLIEKSGLLDVCKSISVIGLSQAVADVLQTSPWRSIHVAANPSEDEMLACLQTELP